MRGNRAERWFEGFSDGWRMSLDVTAADIYCYPG